MGLFSAIFYGVAAVAFVIAAQVPGFLAVDAMITGAAFLISASVLAAGALIRAAIRKATGQKAAPPAPADEPSLAAGPIA